MSEKEMYLKLEPMDGESLTKALLEVRNQQKKLKEHEAAIKAELETVWGPVELKTESRYYGNMRLTARRQARMGVDPRDFFSYLTAEDKTELWPELTETKVKRAKLEKAVKEKLLPKEALNLLRETSSYIVWVPEETE